MSLLQDVLRSHAADSKTIERKLNSLAISNRSPSAAAIDKDDSDDELVTVVGVTALDLDPMSHLCHRSRFQEHPQEHGHHLQPAAPLLVGCLVHYL